jgi:hypothetical protein
MTTTATATKTIAAKQSDKLMDAAMATRLAGGLILRAITTYRVRGLTLHEEVAADLMRAVGELEAAGKMIDAVETQLHRTATAA